MEEQAKHNHHPPKRVRQCPPHKWRSHEQPDGDGTYLKCIECGAFPGYTDERQ